MNAQKIFNEIQFKKKALKRIEQDQKPITAAQYLIMNDLVLQTVVDIADLEQQLKEIQKC